MKFFVNGKPYNCITTAWTPIRYYLRYRKSFLKEWNESIDKTELLMRLFYIAINDSNLSFADFKKECEADEIFEASAFALFRIIFASDHKKRKSEDYGIEYNELTFLATFGKSGLPEKVLDELTYFDVMEIFAIQGDLQNPDNYKHRMATPEERKQVFGITAEVEAELEKYLLGG